ncbi:aspartyl protease, putative [Theileria equi strain WA]|uniref:Aspartyl protease, putative n=1 Tax=Theileria equi strain WA TaxID=1537102 RepID=L1LFG6_THEEQ|nr:aspartyl protease, putative [Theileria equi strain WA]EKX73893.1 aspartyl protease, putative [Theileria equi strain WA]|eukprot:XP_004833345.1 aspartyl protease, putative [Theileria equi strain WA]
MLGCNVGLIFLLLSIFSISRLHGVQALQRGQEEGEYYDISLSRTDSAYENECLRILDNEKVCKRSPKFFDLKNVISSSIALQADYTSRMWATYYGGIRMGPSGNQLFKVLFDTGSSEFWLPGDSCISQQCKTRQRYHKTSSWKPMLKEDGNSVPISIKYLSGEIKAVDGTTTVRLSDSIVLENVNVGLATNINVPVMSQVHWDGIVGLGFRTKEMEYRGAKTFLESLMDNKSLYPNFRNQVAYYVSKEGGNISFGGINPKFKKSQDAEFFWAPIEDGSTYWSLNLVDMHLKNSKKRNRFNTSSFALSNGQESRPIYKGTFGDLKVIMDTGSYLMYAPQSMSSLVDELRVESCDEVGSKPTLVFTFKSSNGTKFPVELKPQDYILSYQGSDGNKKCTLGIVVDDQQEVSLGIL